MKKRLLSALLSLVLIVALIPNVAYATSDNPYTDVSTSDWYYPAVEYMSTKGHMTGYSATTFAPNDTLSRAMFVTVLYRISGEKVSATNTKFTDVAQGTWYTEAVTWAVANGITSGTSTTTFSPNDPVTREQMATFLKRYIDNKSVNVSDAFKVTTVPTDAKASSGWAKDSVQFMYQHGILLMTDNKVNPKSNSTRIETAIAFYNLLCLTKATNDGQMLLSYNYYNDDLNISCSHNWAVKHYDAIGHYEKGETHEVMINKCAGCGYQVNSDMPNANEIWERHLIDCGSSYSYWTEQVPNGEPKWIIDYPAYDVTYCTFCGQQKSEVTAHTHNWATRHVDEVGHYESNGTHTVRRHVCDCGNFDMWDDESDFRTKYLEHYDPFNNGCEYASVVWEVEKPNDPTWVVDVPAHDETYCSICGATK